MSTYVGNKIKVSIFGQSHSKAIGVNIEGLPAGIFLDEEKLIHFLNRRKPQLKSSTTRIEEDRIEILSGIVNQHTCGTAFCAIIKNKAQISSDYDDLFSIPRPGHCDYPAYVKYGRYHDFSGGGHFSGRLTAALCIAGGFFLQILDRQGIHIAAHIANIGNIRDELYHATNPESQIKSLSKAPFTVINHDIIEKINSEIEGYAKKGDSIGGSVECAVTGLPAGIGDTMFDSLESRISQLVFSVPAVKAIEFGSGFISSSMSGKAYNDCYRIEHNKVITKTNHCGGIAGGLSNGMPIIFRAAFKPTPSIRLPQESIDLNLMKNTVVSVKGRHDSCIVPRAVPVIEAATAIACYDAL